MTIAELIDKYIDEVTITMSQNTVRNYERCIRPLADICGDEQLKREHIVEYMRRCKASGNSANTIRSKMACVRAFETWLVDNGAIPNRISGNVKLPQPEYHIADRLTKEEASLMIHGERPRYAHNDTRNRAILELALVTASRVSAICDLTTNDVDFEKKTITFRHTKRNKELVMPMTESLCDALEDYIENYRPKGENVSDALFVGTQVDKNGNYTKLTRQSMDLICRRYTANVCGRPLSMHDLRHTSASIQIDSGLLSIDEISKNLGHSSVATTQRYAQRLNDRSRRTATIEIFKGL